MGVVAGRTSDFDAWVVTEHRRVFGLCRRLLEDSFEADSATQDVFLKAHRALGSAVGLRDPGRWLTRVAVNTCLDRLRSPQMRIWQRRPKPADEELILEMRAATGPSAEDQLFAEQIQRRLVEAMETLSPRQRSVFELRYMGDRSIEQIAEILELDIGTVKAHLARATVKIRSELADLYEPRRISGLRPAIAAAVTLLLAFMLFGPEPDRPLIAQRDARLLNEVSRLVQGPEPPAITPIHALFEED